VRTPSLLAALGLAASLLLTPAAAQAAVVLPGADEDPAGDFFASHITTDGAMSDPVCFDTQDELDAYLTGVGVTSPQARALSPSSPSAAAAQVVLGSVYKNANLTGAKLTLYGSGSVCDGVTYGFSSLASGWNNSISSAAASTGCWMTLYNKTSYAGDRITCTPICDSVGSLLNDKVKSLVFRPTGQFG
jgi:hypothetical protein